MNFTHAANRRTATRRLLACVALASPLLVYASKDRLEEPAYQARKAAKAMMLDLTSAGSRLVAVGEYGVALYSDTKGQSWHQAEVPVSVTLTAAHFPTPKTGWAVGHDGVILRSDDGGARWIKQFDGNDANRLVVQAAQRCVDEMRASSATAVPAEALKSAESSLEDAQAGAKFGPSRPLFGVWFKDASEGLVVGAFGQIFHTSDGGKTWASWADRLSNQDGLHLNSISTTGAGSLVIAAEAGKVYRSQNEGKSWAALDTGYKGQLYGVLGIRDERSREILIAYGFGGRIYRSVDEGASWQVFVLPERKPVVSGKVLADGRILLLSFDGNIYRSADKGQTYSRQGSVTGMTAAALMSIDVNTVVIAGIGGTKVVNVNQPTQTR